MSFSRRLFGAIAWVPVVLFTHNTIGTVRTVSDDLITLSTNGKEERSKNTKFVLVRKLFAQPTHGQLVALRSPFDKDQILVRRVVGLPGDWINTPIGDGRVNSLQHVSEGKCWVEYDHPSDLKHKDYVDSRTNGTIPLALVEGIVEAVLWPNPHIVKKKCIEGRLREKKRISV